MDVAGGADDTTPVLRELYQNAVDALLRRDARLEFLRRTDKYGAWLEAVQNSIDSWHELPDITVTETEDNDGIHYLECTDHGIGMGLNELAGIGTRSYFRIADTVEIHTAPLKPDGTTGNQIHALIPGPGEYFRVHDLGAAIVPGTRVRLRLKPDIDRAPVATFRELVIVSPYGTAHRSKRSATDTGPE